MNRCRLAGSRSSSRCASANQFLAQHRRKLSARHWANPFSAAVRFRSISPSRISVAESLPFDGGRGAEQHQDRKRQFAVAQIGPERLADLRFVSGDVETIIVNLIGRANFQSEILQRAKNRRLSRQLMVAPNSAAAAKSEPVFIFMMRR